MWQAEEVCNGYVIWTCDFCGCRRKPPARTFESARCLVLRTWLTLIPNLQTNVRSSSADQRWASQRSRNSSVMQFCNKFITIFLPLSSFMITCAAPAIKFLQTNVMSHTHDSENVNRLWSDRPQPRGYANIIRCLWCFTLLMNLHDFVTESFNPEHIFRDAHTVPFCLTADHIATCHMSLSLCPHQASAVLVCLWTLVVWKVFGTCDDGIWSHSWSPTRRVETWQLPWSSMDRLVEKSGSLHEVPWRGVVETWQLPWSSMDSSVLDGGLVE